MSLLNVYVQIDNISGVVGTSKTFIVYYGILVLCLFIYESACRYSLQRESNNRAETLTLGFSFSETPFRDFPQSLPLTRIDLVRR